MIEQNTEAPVNERTPRKKVSPDLQWRLHLLMESLLQQMPGRDVAKLCEVSQSMISRISACQLGLHSPNTNTLLRIISNTSASKEWVLTGKGKMFPDAQVNNVQTEIPERPQFDYSQMQEPAETDTIPEPSINDTLQQENDALRSENEELKAELLDLYRSGRAPAEKRRISS